MCAELSRAPLQQHSLPQTSFNSAIVLPSSIFCKCSLFIRRKEKMPWNASRMLAFGKCSYVKWTASLFCTAN